jgi:anti-repressor protein
MANEVIRFDDQQTMSSIEIADATGKQHAHVMRDVRKLIDKINQSTSGLVIPDNIKDDYHRGDRTQYKYLSEKSQNILLDFCFNKTGDKYIIEESTYSDAKGEKRSMYILNKKACFLLASGYDVVLRAQMGRTGSQGACIYYNITKLF